MNWYNELTDNLPDVGEYYIMIDFPENAMSYAAIYLKDNGLSIGSVIEVIHVTSTTIMMNYEGHHVDVGSIFFGQYFKKSHRIKNLEKLIS
jgi:hypothetical protein